MKRRSGETERGRNGEKNKLTDSPIPRFPDSPIRFQMGFSLLEVMAAVVVLGFGLLAIMHLFPIGLRASKISQDTTVASFLAQAKIEELRNTGWSQIVGGAEAYGDITDYLQFKRVTTISDVDAVNDPKLKKVVVEVFYKPYDGERSVKLVTLFTDYSKKM
ncbi:prepilin-type N-terminal cleavage/methylation domain-containing protein [bacterium]|nr:prepilin-type N-terminal cleavage/methylation domain-containing protein [bacterium]